MLRKVNVTVFVDWQSQIGNAGQVAELRPERKAEQTIQYVTKAIAFALRDNMGIDLFSVEMRLYHGWFKGLTATDNQKALQGLFSDGLLPRTLENLTFDWSGLFGDTLLSAYRHRRHPRINVHLPDTLREDFESGARIREKMVDTALVCDLLSSARSSPKDWRIIMGEDDDLIPGVFVSEYWSKEAGGRTTILRRRREFGHLRLEGLIKPLEAAYV